MKNIITIVVILALFSGGLYLYNKSSATAPTPTDSTSITVQEDMRVAEGDGKQAPAQNPEKFSGALEEVNTGCFADGECYIIVDKKHVTVLWGWTQETVGSLKGAESIGNLETAIGRTIEVYANKLADGTYTLYGNAGYYAELKK